MSTVAPEGPFRFGRVRVSSAAAPSDSPDLSNPDVVRAIVDDATRVARAEQRARRRRSI